MFEDGLTCDLDDQLRRQTYHPDQNRSPHAGDDRRKEINHIISMSGFRYLCHHHVRCRRVAVIRMFMINDMFNLSLNSAVVLFFSSESFIAWEIDDHHDGSEALRRL